MEHRNISEHGRWHSSNQRTTCTFVRQDRTIEAEEAEEGEEKEEEPF
jgi:hypothetical protein